MLEVLHWCASVYANYKLWLCLKQLNLFKTFEHLYIFLRVVFRNTNIRTPRYRNDSENLFRFRRKIFSFENFSIFEKYCDIKNTFRKWFFIFEMKKFQPRLIFWFRKIKINVENNFLISRLKYSNRDWFFYFELKKMKSRWVSVSCHHTI